MLLSEDALLVRFFVFIACCYQGWRTYIA